MQRECRLLRKCKTADEWDKGEKCYLKMHHTRSMPVVLPRREFGDTV